MKPRQSTMALFVLGSLLLLFQSSVAANSWYWGKVTQIITYTGDGSFIIYVDNTVLKSVCAYERVIFDEDDMGIGRTTAALSMALAAQASGKDWGVVVNLPAQGSECKASGTSTQGAGIRG